MLLVSDDQPRIIWMSWRMSRVPWSLGHPSINGGLMLMSTMQEYAEPQPHGAQPCKTPTRIMKGSHHDHDGVDRSSD
jgi:hypothetical protein